jgi:signal peptidase I
VPSYQEAEIAETDDWPVLAGPKPASPTEKSSRLAARLLIPLAVVLVLLVGVFYVGFDFGSVDGASMLPNLLQVDGLLVTKGYSQPRRGDIVTLTITGQDGKPDQIVKRIVGIPGDRVEVRNDVAYVNGVAETGYKIYVDVPGRGDTIPEIIVPQGSVYVMGDNRPVSYDSRYIGPQPLSAVQGRVGAIYMPITRWRLVRGIAAENRQ